MGLRSPARFSSVGFWDRFDEDPVWSYLRNVQIRGPPGLLPRRYQADLGWPWYHWPGPVRGWDGISMCFLQAARESMPLKIFEVLAFDCTIVYDFFSSFTHWFHCVSIAFIKCQPRSGTGKTATFAGHSVGESISISVSWKILKVYEMHRRSRSYFDHKSVRSPNRYFLECWLHLSLSGCWTNS